jgi:uncharacterized Zn-finger protein
VDLDSPFTPSPHPHAGHQYHSWPGNPRVSQGQSESSGIFPVPPPTPGSDRDLASNDPFVAQPRVLCPGFESFKPWSSGDVTEYEHFSDYGDNYDDHRADHDEGSDGGNFSFSITPPKPIASQHELVGRNLSPSVYYSNRLPAQISTTSLLPGQENSPHPEQLSPTYRDPDLSSLWEDFKTSPMSVQTATSVPSFHSSQISQPSTPTSFSGRSSRINSGAPPYNGGLYSNFSTPWRPNDNEIDRLATNSRLSTPSPPKSSPPQASRSHGSNPFGLTSRPTAAFNQRQQQQSPLQGRGSDRDSTPFAGLMDLPSRRRQSTGRSARGESAFMSMPPSTPRGSYDESIPTRDTFLHVCKHIESDGERCKARFKRQEHLKRHEKCHTHLREFQCEHCLKQFSRNDNLKAHKKTHMKMTGRNQYIPGLTVD